MSGLYVSVVLARLEIWNVVNKIVITNDIDQIKDNLEPYRMKMVTNKWNDATMLVT